MNKEYSMIFQKNGVETYCKDLQDDFGFVCTEINIGDIESKELESNNWLDEDGEDVYIPSVVRYGGMDLTISLVYSGNINTHQQKLRALVDYLRGADVALGLNGIYAYSAYHQRGFANCYFKSVSEMSLYKTESHECFECKLVMRVCSPSVIVNATKSSNGRYILTKA